MSEVKFFIGQIVQHQLFDYRGVIIDVDYKFLGNDKWYDEMARSRPPKDQPWYHVLVNNGIHQTYVAERNLMLSKNDEPIHHPSIERYFTGLKKGCYQLKTRIN
ncbi:MAG: heat shock protein HspQ [Methylococcales bacterium]|jgi:heat shock protein HspQ|nr:heat shock protein HspQ [Methylococcales bacterium]